MYWENVRTQIKDKNIEFNISEEKWRQLLRQLRQDRQRRVAASIQQRVEKPPPHPGVHVAAGEHRVLFMVYFEIKETRLNS